MPTHSSDPKRQFVAVEDLLTRWLKERRMLLGKYTEIVVTLDSNLDTTEIFINLGRQLYSLHTTQPVL